MESIGRHENYSIPPGYPDLEFTKQKVPIQDVARQLGLKVSGRYRAHCWRFDNHRNGDRDPSITFQKKTNRGRCWVCDGRTWSNLDLVMMFLGCDFRSAVAWVCEHFPVPPAEPGKHLVHRNGWHPRYRVGTNGSVFEWLVRAGLWGWLSPAQRSVLVALQAFTDAETGLAKVSYRGLMRYSGVGSATSVAVAIKRFRRIHLLQVEPRIGGDGFRACNCYRLTFDDPKFLSLLNEIHRRNFEEVELERAFRAEERKRRRRQRESVLPVKVTTLSSGWSTGKFDGTTGVARD